VHRDKSRNINSICFEFDHRGKIESEREEKAGAGLSREKRKSRSSVGGAWQRSGWGVRNGEECLKNGSIESKELGVRTSGAWGEKENGRPKRSKDTEGGRLGPYEPWQLIKLPLRGTTLNKRRLIKFGEKARETKRGKGKTLV